MMNVLSDILCDSVSLMVSQNYNEPLLSHDKMLPTHNTIVSSKKGTMHLLDTLSNISEIDRPLNALNNSSPSNIDIFTASDQVHLSTSLESGSFHDGSQVSAFSSNSFQEIVPSWLAHDFMKVSADLPPFSADLPSLVSVPYPCTRESENLEMLDLGFPPELTSQDINAGTMNRSHISNTQKLLSEEPMQRFSTADSLLISSFNNINNSQLQMPMTKNSTSYQKYKHNSPQSMMNAVLPCDNDLLHIPLSSSITDQCLNTSSSPSMLSRNQCHSNSVDMVCNKLPQISLNHLDTLLGNENTLPSIQLLRHDFPNVSISEDVNANQLNQVQSCINNCNANTNGICSTANFQNTNMTPVSHSQDISVQVSVSLPQQNSMFINKDCSSCTGVPLETPIEITQCFKCKFCSYVSLHKCSVANHISLSHSKSFNGEASPDTGSKTGSTLNQSPDSVHSTPIIHVGSNLVQSTSAPMEGENGSCISKSATFVALNNCLPSESENNSWTQLCSETDPANILMKVINNQFVCNKCDKVFPDLNECKSHLVSFHSIKFEYLNYLLLTSKNNVSSPLVLQGNSIHTPSNENHLKSFSESKLSDKASKKKNVTQSKKKNITPLRLVAPKKTDEVEKVVENKKVKSKEINTQDKKVSSHKEAWRKKMKRELGSYICEFKGCNVRFQAVDNLEYHRKCHISGGNTFACPECEMKFDNWPVIAGHLWRIHSNDMELHACDQCPFRTYNLGRLENIHKRIHQAECLFLCDTCGKSFKNGKQLRNHRDTHASSQKMSKRKPADFKCDICQLHFASKKLLKIHEKDAHNKQNLHVCNYCEYTTSKTSNLKMHLRQHTGEKPFSCEKCDYRTADHNSLRRHKMTHSGEKPYKCPYCPYASIQASTYKDHLKNQHPDQNEGLMFCCNQCSFRTIKQDTYVEHVMEHEQLNNPAGRSANPLPQPTANEDAEMFSLVEAMDISLSHGDNTLLSSLNKDKINIQSFLRNLNMNMTSIYDDGVI